MYQYHDDHMYADGISYPPNYTHPGNDNFLATKSSAPLNPIYGRELTNLTRHTQASLTYLREKLIKQDPCYAHDMKHWHRKHEPPPLFSDDYPSDRIPQWERSNGVFTSTKDWKTSTDDTNHKESRDESSPVKLCYLCTTLDEHKQHLAKRGMQLKAKPKRKPRVEYIPPPPIVKKKVVEQEEKAEVLYKIIVRTGNKREAGTKANVHVRLRGKKGSMKKKTLQKKLAVSFSFGQGTTETFHIKGPDIGDLKWLTIEHDGLEKKHGWYLEEVEITNMNTQQTWIFVCRQWLSLYIGDFNIKRELQAQEWEIPDMEYEIDVHTGKESMAGTDSNVFITFYGKKGVSPKHPLKNKSKDKDNFERGQKDQFFVVTKDIGVLSNIKMEHDNTGTGPGWLLEQVVVRELVEPGRTYSFPCGQWLARDEGDKQIHKMLYPVRKDKRGHDVILGPGGKPMAGRRRGQQDNSADQLKYEVSIVTGTLRYAGTDATIYIKMHGTLGIAREMEFKDTNGKRFEKGATDEFKLKADDVGDIKQLTVRHDNAGMAAGWFCETITIKRYFSKTEIAERLVNMQHELDENINRRASQITGQDVDLVTRRRSSLKYKGSTHSNHDMDSDEEKPSRKGHKSPKHRRSSSDSDSDEDSRRKSKRSPKRSPRRESKNPLGRISEESDDGAGGHRRSNRDKERKKTKKISYNGITILVTDDEEEDRSHRKNNKKKSKKSSDSSSDSSSESDHKSRCHKKHKKSKSRKYDSDTDSDEDSQSHKRNQRKSRKKLESSSSESDSFDVDDYSTTRNSRQSRARDSSDEEVTTVWRKDRVPYCDEYLFVCKRWLAEDEDDREIMRVLKPKTITTYYKMSKS